MTSDHENPDIDFNGQNLSQCESVDEVATEPEVWGVVDKDGKTLRTVPGVPRDGRQALLIAHDIPAWDKAARVEADAIRKRFVDAWNDIVMFAKNSHHEDSRQMLGRTLGRFWARLVQEAQHAGVEWSDFTALYYGAKVFRGKDDWLGKNPAFRSAFDEKKKPAKRGEPQLSAWVRGQLAALEHQGLHLWHSVRERGRWPTAQENWASPAWTPETVAKYAEVGFDLAVLSLPPFRMPVTQWANGDSFANLWRDLLEPHFAWAWPQFIKESGDKVRGGRGYARKDFGHHSSTVMRYCSEWFARWDGLAG